MQQIRKNRTAVRREDETTDNVTTEEVETTLLEGIDELLDQIDNILDEAAAVDADSQAELQAVENTLNPVCPICDRCPAKPECLDTISALGLV